MCLNLPAYFLLMSSIFDSKSLDLEQDVKIIAGSARSMGIEVKE